MPERDIVFENISTPHNLFQLKEHLRELYRLLDKRFISVTCDSTVVFDADQSDTFYVELTENITTITINNASTGRIITLLLQQDSTGSRTVAGFASNVKLAGASFTVTSNATRYSTLTLVYDGTNWVEIARALDVY